MLPCTYCISHAVLPCTYCISHAVLPCTYCISHAVLPCTYCIQINIWNCSLELYSSMEQFKYSQGTHTQYVGKSGPGSLLWIQMGSFISFTKYKFPAKSYCIVKLSMLSSFFFSLWRCTGCPTLVAAFCDPWLS